MAATKNKHPKTETHPKHTKAVLKIARALLLSASHHPSGRLLELTQQEIADEADVSVRSVTRTMPILEKAVEHAGRGYWRIRSLAALEAIALDPESTPHNDDHTPTLPLALPSTPAASAASTKYPDDIIRTLIERINNLTATVDTSRLQIAHMSEEIATLKQGRPRSMPPASKRLSKWITARSLPFDQIAAMLNIPPDSLRNYASGLLKPPLRVRERIRARTGIGTKAWDAPLPPHIQKTLGCDFQ